jgi:hypothetical protein
MLKTNDYKTNVQQNSQNNSQHNVKELSAKNKWGNVFQKGGQGIQLD